MDNFFKRYNVFAIVASGVLWGIIGIFVNALTKAGIETADAVLIRCTLSAVVLLVYMLIKEPSKLKIKLRDLWMFLGTGVVSFFVYSSAYFAAIKLTTMAIAAMLLYTSPIFVMLMSAIFYKERITVKSAVAIGATVAGCALVCGGARLDGYPVSGLLWGLLSGFTYALYSIFGRVATKKYHPETVTLYTFVFAGIGALIAGNPKNVAEIIVNTPSVLMPGLGYAVICSVLPYLLYTGGLKYTTPSVAAVTVCIEPVVAAFVGIAAFKESMTAGTIIGSLLILGSIFVKNRE